MSLLRPIIRACAVAALRNRTWAGAQVYDSDMTPFADAVLGQAASPYVCVYTDTDDRTGMTGVIELYNGDFRMLNLVVEMGIASAVKDQNGDIVIQIADTDEGMELAVDVLETQVKASLFGDPKSDWGELLKRFMRNVRRVPSRRGGQAAQGLRFAARRTIFIGNTFDDVAPGVQPPGNHPVWRFIAMAQQADPSLGVNDLATVLQNLLTENAPTPAPDWRQAQAILGLTARAAKDLGVDGTPLPWPLVETPPLDWSDADAAPPLFTELQVRANDQTLTASASTDQQGMFSMPRRRLVRRVRQRPPQPPQPPQPPSPQR